MDVKRTEGRENNERLGDARYIQAPLTPITQQTRKSAMARNCPHLSTNHPNCHPNCQYPEHRNTLSTRLDTPQHPTSSHQKLVSLFSRYASDPPPTLLTSKQITQKIPLNVWLPGTRETESQSCVTRGQGKPRLNTCRPSPPLSHFPIAW